MARREEEALSAAAAHRPDVAVMDLRLADGDCGVTTARKLLQQFGIRCVFLSGNIDMKAEEIREFDPSPIGLLHKPMVADQLLGALRTAEHQITARQQGQGGLSRKAAAKSQAE